MIIVVESRKVLEVTYRTGIFPVSQLRGREAEKNHESGEVTPETFLPFLRFDTKPI